MILTGKWRRIGWPCVHRICIWHMLIITSNDVRVRQIDVLEIIDTTGYKMMKSELTTLDYPKLIIPLAENNLVMDKSKYFTWKKQENLVVGIKQINMQSRNA